jgi:hypothetical protein
MLGNGYIYYVNVFVADPFNSNMKYHELTKNFYDYDSAMDYVENVLEVEHVLKESPINESEYVIDVVVR